MAAESKLERYLVKRVKALKGENRKVKWIGRIGAPDRLIWLPAWERPVWIELKAPGKQLAAHQKREHTRLRKMGLKVCKIDNLVQLKLLLGDFFI